MLPTLQVIKPSQSPPHGSQQIPKPCCAQEQPTTKYQQRRLFVGVVLAILLMFVSMAEMIGEGIGWEPPNWLSGTTGNWLQLFLCSPIVFWGGATILGDGWTGLRRGRPGMFSLIALGVVVSWIVSTLATVAPHSFPSAFQKEDGSVAVFFESAGMIIVLVQIGQILESRARRKTTSSIQALIDLSPPTAEKVLGPGKTEIIALSDIQPGDSLRVKPGERIPTDGTILDGSTSCDESLLTGEPIPVHRTKGDHVLGGALNGLGVITIHADVVATDSLVARIRKLVQSAQAQRAPIEHIVDRVSAVFVPAVLVISLATFVGWSMFGPQPRMVLGLLSSVSVLVVACPCALGLATPLAMTVAIGKGAQNGILVRNSEAIEKLDHAKIIAFDKTGTLTQGHPVIERVCFFNDAKTLVSLDCTQPQIWKDTTARSLLAITASIEATSEHALAHAFTNAAKEAQLDLMPVDNVMAFVGSGIQGHVQGRSVSIGTEEFLRQKGVDLTEYSTSRTPSGLAPMGSTMIFVSIDQHLRGWYTLSDTPRPEAHDVIESLRHDGYHTVVLSGDTARSAKSVATNIGISEAYGGLTPADKADWITKCIEKEKSKKLTCVFIGDGINDAPAMASADVGIAMGSGADVAIQTADITLLSGGLRALPNAIDLAKKTMRVVHQNLLLAFLYNALMIPLAAGVLYPFLGHVTSPMLAAAAMTLSSLSVIANSLRLR